MENPDYIDGRLCEPYRTEFSLARDDSWSIGRDLEPGGMPNEFFHGAIDDVCVRYRPE